ncbi:tyrosine-type recombinase/integrase [Neisseria sp. Ec49-e6-T10]|uniref:tyrosine-type recombinase/integrase n=1 Tax=Neisseria sp. Ec49-e6-T10 TaxID=3140744 RepID=UPI003EC1058C
MGKPRTKNTGLPRNVYLKHGAYYYVRNNKWTRLAKKGDESGMYKALSGITRMENQKPAMLGIFERYEREVLPTKAKGTIKDQKHHLHILKGVFGKMDPTVILPKHIAQYLDTREAKIAANREIALLSHVFKKAIRWGLAEKNPCLYVEKNQEKPCDRYIADWEFHAVYQQAATHIQILMDLAYITGQRQADLLKIKHSDISEEGIFFEQNKTGTKIIVVWSDALRDVVNRAKKEFPFSAEYLVVNARGQKYGSSGIQTAWQRLIVDCIKRGIIQERFTFRDIRAKARSDGDDKKLLGHANPEAMAKIYQRKPVKVQPVK